MRVTRATLLFFKLVLVMFVATSIYWHSLRGPSLIKTPVVKYILLYTPFFIQKDWYFGLGQEPFVSHKCPVQNCFVTNNPNYLANQSDYDAILFHLRNFKNFPDPMLRTPNQVYVMFLMESPLYSANFPYHQFKSVFNWTMTYRRDSTVKSPYGWLVPISDPDLGP